MNQRKNTAKQIGRYTLCYVILFAACYGTLLLSGRMPVWEIDGSMQHYPFIVYIGQWLRGLFTGASGMYDFSLGLGEDVLAAVNYYGLGDPLTLIAALFSGEATEWCYLLLMAIKGWLAGLACMAFARKLKFDSAQATISGVVYAFSLGIFTLASTRHAMFVNPYIHLPLILLGVEHVFDREKPWILSLAIALSALCGFYFLYANSVILLIYAVIRHLSRGTDKPLRSLPMTAARAIGWYLLGIGLAAAVFLPVVWGFFGAQRAASGLSLSGLKLHYSLKTYLKYPRSLLTSTTTNAVPFMPAACFLGAALMLIRWKRNRRWLPMIAAALVMLVIPATGVVLNGFSYETNRWMYSMYLLAALIGGKMIPELLTASKKERVWLAIVCAGLVGYCALMLLRGTNVFELGVAVALIVLIAAALPFAEKHPQLVRGALACTLGISIVFAHINVSLDKKSTMMKMGESWAALEESPFAALPETTEFSRTDTTIQTTDMFNAPAIAGTASTSVYNSLISGTYHGFMQDVACAGLLQTNAMSGFDGRAALEALWSVGRYVAEDGAQSCVPYGFEALEPGVYENQFALPIGYAFTGTISEDAYAALSPLERQWALLQAAVTDDAASVPQIQPKQTLQEIEILGTAMENITVDGETLEVGEGAVIRLTFDAPADSELYVKLDGLAFPTGEIDLNNLLLMESGAASTSALLVREGIAQDLGREFLLVNIGYDENARTTAEIRFARAGTYRLAGLTLYAQPMGEFAGMIGELQERSLQNAIVESDRVYGTVSMDKPGVMQFSIPYSAGWTAAIDGEEIETLCTAGAFLAIEVPEGDHEIELTYRTPMLRAGIALTVLSALALILLGRRKEHKK